MIQFKAKTSSGEIVKSALRPFTFPAGEAHIKREERRELEPTEIAVIYGSAKDMHNDLFHLAMWNDYLLRKGSKAVAVIPYFPGARADKDIPFGARVYANFIDTLALDQILIFDPHSQEIELELGRTVPQFTAVFPHELLNTRDSKILLTRSYDGIVAPDKGALVRASEVARAWDIPVYTATKSRNPDTGKLTFGAVDELPDNSTLLVVDDICDGGGTFYGLASAIKQATDNITLDLYVSHGVFSGAALSTLPLFYRRIFTTNTYDPGRDLLLCNDFGEPLFHYDTFRRIDVVTHLLDRI